MYLVGANVLWLRTYSMTCILDAEMSQFPNPKQQEICMILWMINVEFFLHLFASIQKGGKRKDKLSRLDANNTLFFLLSPWKRIHLHS